MVYANAAGRISWRSNMLRLAYADSGSACKLAQDMVPTAHTQIDVRAQPLESSLGRVPQAADETRKQTSFNQIVLVVEVSLPRFRGHKNERECWQGECFMDNASKRAKHLRRCFIARIQSRSCSPFPNQGSFHRSCRCRSEFW